jgi:hypothetical protein
VAPRGAAAGAVVHIGSRADSYSMLRLALVLLQEQHQQRSLHRCVFR